MSPAEIRTLLAERAQAVDGIRPERVDEVFGRILARRRRRATLTLSGAVCVVLAVILGITLVTGGSTPRSRPIDPAPTPHQRAAGAVRSVTYSDGYWPATHLQYGEHRVNLEDQLAFGRPGRGGIRAVVHMDLTDDGVVFTTEGGGIWFTDGTSTRLIGRTTAYLGIRAADVVMTGTSGSTAAWLADDAERGRLDVVAYDTAAGREVMRISPAGCAAARNTCEMSAVVGDHVYWVLQDMMHSRPDVLTRLDLTTSRQEEVTARDLAADVAGAPRALVLGDSLDTGVVGTGYGIVFAVKGERLVPMKETLAPDDADNSATNAFDAGTGKEVRFRLPPGYGGPAKEFTAFEWVDDDRLALMNAANSWRQSGGEILVCRLSTGGCELAVGPKSTGVDGPRIAPHLGLPG